MKFDTQVKIYDHHGNLEVETKNVTALGGRVAMESIFKGGFLPQHHLSISSSLKNQKGNDPATFSNPTELTAADTTVAADYYGRKIGYFCIGIGGIDTELPLAMAKPRNYETRLYNMVPFRCVPVTGGDLTTVERAKYRMRRREFIGNVEYYTYYLKSFDLGSLNLVDSNGNDYTPAYNDSQPVNPSSANDHPLSQTAIHSCFEFNLNIDSTEFKEFHKAMWNGELTNAKLTEFGIVLSNDAIGVLGTDGVTPYDEVRNVELFSKVVHSPSYMDQEENGKRITYTIFS